MTHRQAFGLLLAVLLAYFAPVIFRGEVIFPHDNRVEVGAQPVKGERISNRKFSDMSSTSIPELHHQLLGNAHGWISTWNPHVEMGRPTWQFNGLGKAFVLTHALSLVSDDAFLVYTWLTVLAVSLIGDRL